MNRSTALLVLFLAACKGDDGLYVFNEAPNVTIIEPTDATAFEQHDTITFVGRVADDTPVESLEIQWSSSLDGILPAYDPPDTEGNVSLATANLSPGTHTITLRAFDPDGDNGEDTITIDVIEVPERPSITVVHPVRDDRGLENEPYVFMANVSDHQDPPENLVIELTANPGGFVCWMVADGSGNASCSATMSLGTYLMTFTVTDQDGNTATAPATFEVVSRGDFDADGDGHTPNGGDCNDSAPTVYPGAPEECDGLDNDCNVYTPIDVGTDCYDDDFDGYCESPPCVNAASGIPDCDDADPTRYPNGASETINGIDDNCNGLIDEGTVVYDDDGDGACESPPCVNVHNNDPDCDDGNPYVAPDVDEDCSTGYDDNCDGQLNGLDSLNCTNFYKDDDGDTYGVSGPTKCYCGSGVAPYTGVNTSDCYDSNNLAHPGTTAYYSGPRGDNSYDYNCDGIQEKQYQGTFVGTCSYDISLFECSDPNPGWSGSEKSCGQSGTWVDGCENNVDYTCAFFCVLQYSQPGPLATCVTGCGSCDKEQSSYTQTCR